MIIGKSYGAEYRNEKVFSPHCCCTFVQQPKPRTSLHRLDLTGFFVIHMVEALSEALVLAEKCALGTENLQSWVEVMYPRPYLTYPERMKNGSYVLGAQSWVAKLECKDYKDAKSLAETSSAEVKGLDVVGQHVQDIINYSTDESKGDIAGIYGVIRREAGLDFENQTRE